MANRKVLPTLRSLPITNQIELENRAELIPKIESGELDHIDFKARVYRNDKKNKNHYLFKDDDMLTFAKSFEGQLFLRNHNLHDIDARDGTIIDSDLEGHIIKQNIRLTTRRGMLDFVEGKIDRFSIGWDYDDVICSICNNTWLSKDCYHWVGQKYEVGNNEKVCELTFTNPRGKETSAVNDPGAPDTGIDSLQTFKLEVFGDVTAVTHAHRASTPLLKGVNHMLVKVRRDGAVLMVEETEVLPTDERITEKESEQARAALDLQGANQRLAAMQEQQERQNEIHIANLKALLDNSLAASKLPSASQKAVRKPFAMKLDIGETFLPTELEEAISDKREELAALSENNVTGAPSRGSYISAMFTGDDQYKAALADLLGAERDEELAKLKVRPLSGIREAYILATGDINLMGGYYREFSLVSANFPSTVADLLNKMLVKSWDDFGKAYGWWEKIATVEHFTNLQDVKWIKTGTIASLPTVAERGEYTELPIGDSREESTWGKSGGYIPLTIEAIINDDIRAFRSHPKEAALAGRRNISEKVAAIFTDNSGAGPTLQDSGALFNATAVTTTGGHANLLTTALGSDYTAWDAVAQAVYNQPLPVKDDDSSYIGTGKKQAVDPKFCLVPRALRAAANALFIPRWASSVESIASAGGPDFAGVVEPITVPEWTDATDWAAVADPMLYPGVMIGEIFGLIPQLFSASRESDPAMFSNDESRLKIRQFVTVGVADFRPLHKSNVAG